MTLRDTRIRAAFATRALIFVLAIVVPVSTAAEPPEAIRVQGAIALLLGSPVTDGNYNFLVQLFDVASGGQALFDATVTAPIAGGAYSLPIIPATPGDLTEALTFGGGPRFVQITVLSKVGGSQINQALLPRQQLVSVPYALDSTQEAAFGTGDVKLTFKNVADPGWILIDDDDGSIGNAASGASTQSEEANDLFMLLWANIPDPWLTLQNSAGASAGRGTSALNDWNANKRLVLPKALGRALAVAGAGSGLSARALGQTVGSETHTLTVGEIPAHHHQMLDRSSALGGASGQQNVPYFGGDYGPPFDTYDTGGTQEHSIMQPTLFLNVMIKL